MKINFYITTVGIFGGIKAIVEYANRLHNFGENVTLYLVIFNFRDYINFLIKQKTGRLFKWTKLNVPLKVIYYKFTKTIVADCHIATYWETAEFLQTKNIIGRKFYFVQNFEHLWGGEKERVKKTYTPAYEYIVLSFPLKQFIFCYTGKKAEVVVTPVTPSTITFKEGLRKKFDSYFRIGYHFVNKRFKGFQEFESAILKLEEEIENLKVVILTTEKYNKFLFKNYEIWLSPVQEELVEYYNSLDLFVSTSWYEGLGMTLMEALACKVPILATDSWGCKEFAKHLETAYLVKSNSVRDIVEGIKTLYENSNLRERIAQNGYNEIQKYNWTESAMKFLAFLKLKRGN